MKKIIIAVSLVLCVLLPGVLGSCASSDVSTKVTFRIVAGDEVLVDEECTIKTSAEEAETISVTDILVNVIDNSDENTVIELDSTGKTLKKCGNYYTAEIDGISYFWDYTINGKSPESGRADSNYVADGDKVVYTFMQTSGENQTSEYDSESGVFGADEEE